MFQIFLQNKHLQPNNGSGTKLSCCKIPFWINQFLDTWTPGFRGKVDGNQQQRLFSRNYQIATGEDRASRFDDDFSIANECKTCVKMKEKQPLEELKRSPPFLFKKLYTSSNFHERTAKTLRFWRFSRNHPGNSNAAWAFNQCNQWVF